MAVLNYKLRKILCLLQQLTHSNSIVGEELYLEAKDLLSESLANRIFELTCNPAQFEDDDVFLDGVIQDLKNEVF